ncbi:MAG: outer membrane beta-barrel protein [Chitinophagales bacterium]|nr:outer membrane beta-barrel protein [Chitinophagales bacterium]
MKKVISCLLFITLLFLCDYSKANDAEGSGHDVGFSIGPNFALTDLGGANKIGSPFLRDVDFKATRYCISAFYRYNVNKIFAVRANLMYGMLKADDRNTDGRPPAPGQSPDDSWFRARRNLNFETHMFEFQAIGEVNLKKYIHNEAKGSKERWAPYLGAGLGFFYFNPYTYEQDAAGNKIGSKIKLRPLGTEGQTIGYKKMYSNFQFDLMALLGIKYNVTELFSIALEGVYHQTFTDYLDDVSGSYVNPQDVSSMSPIAQVLQNRVNTGRYPQNEHNYVEGQKDVVTGNLKPIGIGQQRGDKKDNDQFFHVQLTFSFSLGATGKRLGFGSCGKRNPYHHKFACPKW